MPGSSAFTTGDKFGRIYIQKIKYPVDEPEFDVFRVLEELAGPKFQIPLRTNAKFTGGPEARTEFNERVQCSCDGGVKPCIVHSRSEPG